MMHVEITDLVYGGGKVINFKYFKINPKYLLHPEILKTSTFYYKLLQNFSSYVSAVWIINLILI